MATCIGAQGCPLYSAEIPQLRTDSACVSALADLSRKGRELDVSDVCQIFVTGDPKVAAHASQSTESVEIRDSWILRNSNIAVD